MAIYEPDNEFSEGLKRAKKKYLGVFDTGLRCNCDEANIMDHATAEDLHASLPNTDNVRFGPGLTHREQLEGFLPFHEYFCDACGAIYHQSVIEGRRGYRTLEVWNPIECSSKHPEIMEVAHRIRGKVRDSKKRKPKKMIR